MKSSESLDFISAVQYDSFRLLFPFHVKKEQLCGEKVPFSVERTLGLGLTEFRAE